MQTLRPKHFERGQIVAPDAGACPPSVWQMLSIIYGYSSWHINVGKTLFWVILTLLFLTLAAVGQAREAGWVPIEKYSNPMLKGNESAPSSKNASRQKIGSVKKVIAQPRRDANSSVYDGQAPITEKELLAFVEILPQFRSWAHSQKEEAHPTLRNGQADFLFSQRASDWVREHGWEAARFFCVMGKMAAALVIVEEGNDMQGTRPPDMPPVDPQELSLARKHLGSLLKVSYQGGAIRQ